MVNRTIGTFIDTCTVVICVCDIVRGKTQTIHTYIKTPIDLQPKNECVYLTDRKG